MMSPTELLLRLCGVKIDSTAHLAGARLALRNADHAGWVVLLALFALALTWWSYRRVAGELTSQRRRWVLTALRAVLFLLLLLMLLRPVLAFTVEGTIRRQLLMLVDTSASMKIQDPRFDPADLARAAMAKGLLDFRKGLQQPLDPAHAASVRLVPRVELLQGVLKSDQLGLIQKFAREYDVSAFGFGQNLAEIGGGGTPQPARSQPAKPAESDTAWIDQLDPKSQSTAIGDAVRELLERKRGQPLAGIFLATDGANNTGTQPIEAARLARAEGVPLYIYGVGITSPRDIIVANLFTQEVAFAKDELPVTVRVRGQGLRGETAKITLKLGDEIVASKDLIFTNDEEQTVALPFTPKQVGEYELRASIDPRADEAAKDNNAVSQRLKVIDSKIKVLMVEESPRWEFRYLQSVLLRDRRIELKCWLAEGDPNIAEGADSPYVKTFPQTKDELFKYDLVVIGDVGAKDIGAPQMEWLGEFVSKFGGSCLFLAGPRNNPSAFRGTELEKMLPVELSDGPARNAAPERPTTLELTALGRSSPMLRLSAKDEENAAIWKRFPKLFWVARVTRAKAAAQVLLQDSDATKASRFGKMPVVAQQQYGLGQVLYVGTDNTWRWRRNADERYYPILWGQIAQKLGLSHLLGGSKRTQISADKQSYAVGERVTIYARLYTADFNPLKDSAVEGSYVVKTPADPNPPDTSRQNVTLRAVPDRPGMYRGDFTVLAPGVHQFSVKSDPATVFEFSATEARFEFGETAMNEALLKQMAELSGGAFFREENLFQLPEALRAKSERVSSVVDAEIWASPLYFLLLLTVATVEWALRKRVQLK
ncbi:MAG: VWA domain-containing protein [Chthoniobacter sp.]|nr:VWA domain-containing protein [Chthoniobacter sp.]